MRVIIIMASTQYKKILLIDAPTSASDATNKSYVDSIDGRQVNTIQTTTATPTTIATIATISNRTIATMSVITARRSDTTGSYATFMLSGSHFNDGTSPISQIGADDLSVSKTASAGNYTVSTSVSGPNVLIQVTGDTGHTVEWKAITHTYTSD